MAWQQVTLSTILNCFRLCGYARQLKQRGIDDDDKYNCDDALDEDWIWVTPRMLISVLWKTSLQCVACSGSTSYVMIVWVGKI